MAFCASNDEKLIFGSIFFLSEPCKEKFCCVISVIAGYLRFFFFFFDNFVIRLWVRIVDLLIKLRFWYRILAKNKKKFGLLRLLLRYLDANV